MTQDISVTSSTSTISSNYKIAVYRGSFDPPHYGHQQIIQYCLDIEKCDKVYVIIFNQAFFDRKPNRSDYLSRMGMLDIAFSGDPRVVVTSEAQYKIIEETRKLHPNAHVIKPMGDDKVDEKRDSTKKYVPDEYLIFPRDLSHIAQIPETKPQEISFRVIDTSKHHFSGYSSTQIRTFLASHDEFYDNESKSEYVVLKDPERNRKMNDFIRKRNLYRRPVNIDVTQELQDQCVAIQRAYSLSGNELNFRKLKGGICNAPIYVYEKVGDKESPVGVIKLEVESYEVATSRFSMLDEMTTSGFKFNPKVFKNKNGDYLTTIGSRLYSMMEYITPDAGEPENQLSFIDMLALTGKFHASSQKITGYSGLEMLRYALHMSRQSVVNDVEKLGLDEDLLQSSQWKRMISLYQYFASKEAKEIFQSLPKQIINGDNHHGNLVFRNHQPYFIDLDARRIDLRLYDITSIIRGATAKMQAEYEVLVKNGTLYEVIDDTYGKLATPLTLLEKQKFPLILAFSYIEFFSWILNRIRREGSTPERIAIMKEKLNSLISVLDLYHLHPMPFETVNELRDNTNAIKLAFGHDGNLQFRKLLGGNCNAPVYVYEMKEEKESPVGVFKLETKTIPQSIARFQMLDRMAEMGYRAHPQIFKNKQGEYLTKIGAHYYSFIEFITSDNTHQEKQLRLTDMVSLADEFHSYSQKIPDDNPDLHRYRFQAHLDRQDIINHLDEMPIGASLFNSPEWKRIETVYRFFVTQEAKNIFAQLPKHAIIGDNHHDNLVYRQGHRCLIDLDSRRFDVRLYDFTITIRHMGEGPIFSDFLELMRSGNFFKTIEQYYPVKSSLPLTDFEKQHFSTVLVFAYVDFISWGLNELKIMLTEGRQPEAVKHVEYLNRKVNILIGLFDQGILNEDRFKPVSSLRRNSIHRLPSNDQAPIETLKEASQFRL